MKRFLAFAGLLALLGGAAARAGAGDGDGTVLTPRYTASGDLVFPTGYRDWAYLSTGLGMSYAPFSGMAMGPLFDNVFVPRAALAAFRATGRWPDPTTFVIEVRAATSHGSINKAGHYQGDVVGFDLEVKDSTKPDTWRYYSFASDAAAKSAHLAAFPKNAGCFACHAKSGAVEHTFVQFYPTLLSIARAKGTLNASYRER